MGANRPDFNKIKSYEEFIKYYWYREELSKICKQLNIDHSGTKQELIYHIKEYFSGNMIRKKKSPAVKNIAEEITLDCPLLYCGFAFNAKYDRSSCEWNKFLKDFCQDERNAYITNKLKAAAVLWNIVRESSSPKVYSYSLVLQHKDLLESYY